METAEQERAVVARNLAQGRGSEQVAGPSATSGAICSSVKPAMPQPTRVTMKRVLELAWANAMNRPMAAAISSSASGPAISACTVGSA